MTNYSINTYITSDSIHQVELTFKKKLDKDAVARLIFCSKLLHSMAPDESGIWSEVTIPRVDAHYLGFTKNINWKINEKLVLVGSSEKKLDKDSIKMSIDGVIGTKENEFKNKNYKFYIKSVEENKIYTYDFDNRSRALIAFSIIWDKREHPRDDLELHLKPHSDNQLLGKLSTFNGKIYGDPSKTIDELRNQGFPRKTDQSSNGVYISVGRDTSYGTLQENYRLMIRQQSILDKVGRSPIPPKFREVLYDIGEHTCSNCGQIYQSNYLAPDHRVPSIVEADDLNETNYLKKLQILCVRCNQIKREACKKCPYNHKCSDCGWAYPEKFNISQQTLDLARKQATIRGLTIDDYISSLI